MKQLIQDLSNGKTDLIETAMPQCKKNHVLISTELSLISPGTEKMLVDFSKSSLIKKAKNNPDRVKQVLDKVSTDGLFPTISSVMYKLKEKIPLGYCNVGTVIESKSEDFNIGDRVVSNGPHAEIVCVSQNLCCKIPENVKNDLAVFTILGSIGLQGIRLAKPELGENFVIYGVGLIGLLCIQLLKAHGCNVLALDLDDNRLKIAKSFGADTFNLKNNKNLEQTARTFSKNIGVDGVIISTSSSDNSIISNSTKILRKKGRIVLVGTSGLDLKRSDFYEKEISFQVSCSYGPGRYDKLYEEEGIDYPIGYVRWTEKRNFLSILNLMSKGIINVDNLITDMFPFEKSHLAYKFLLKNKKVLGLILKFNKLNKKTKSLIIKNNIGLNKKFLQDADSLKVGFIGSGNYASRVLIPMFKKNKIVLNTLVSQNGISSAINSKKFGFNYHSTDINSVIKNKDINTVVVVTRHDSHADLVIKSLKSKKNVFVEKPLALTQKELDEIRNVYHKSNLHLMVGFNRRFSPLIKIIKEKLTSIKEPKIFSIIMNAGKIPSDHWVQNKSIGGGRIVGEACHCIDLMRFLAGSQINDIQVKKLNSNYESNVKNDNVSITLGFEDGSFGTIHYISNGGYSFPKERLEVHVNNSSVQLDNFKGLKFYNWIGNSNKKLLIQNKGQFECIQSFKRAITYNEPTPIPFDEIYEVSKVTIKIEEMIKNYS